MIKIINTNNKRKQIDGHNNTEWRQAKSQIIPDLNQSSCVPDSEIDAIVVAMDQQESEQQSQLPIRNLNPSKEDVANLMVQQYIQQNGGIPLPDSCIKRNQIIID